MDCFVSSVSKGQKKDKKVAKKLLNENLPTYIECFCSLILLDIVVCSHAILNGITSAPALSLSK